MVWSQWPIEASVRAELIVKNLFQHFFQNIPFRFINQRKRVRDNLPDVGTTFQCDRKRPPVHFWSDSLLCIHFYSNQDVAVLENHSTTLVWSNELPVSKMEGPGSFFIWFTPNPALILDIFGFMRNHVWFFHFIMKSQFVTVSYSCSVSLSLT